MFSPEVEARFKKIEEDLTVSAEILRRFEIEGKERIGRVEAAQETLAQAQDALLHSQKAQARVQDAMARWLDEITEKMNAIADAHARLEDAHARLENTVERFLKARTNGSEN